MSHTVTHHHPSVSCDTNNITLLAEFMLHKDLVLMNILVVPDAIICNVKNVDITFFFFQTGQDFGSECINGSTKVKDFIVFIKSVALKNGHTALTLLLPELLSNISLTLISPTAFATFP